MDKKSDALLRKMLKNWANKQRPPDNGRARLLWDAIHASRSKIDLSILFNHPQHNYYNYSHSNDWSRTLFTWINETSLQFGIQSRLS